MGTRGRKSAASLTVIGPYGLETIRRPGPPECLGDEQAAEWRKVVNSMPADYFPPETHALLEARCCHVVQRRRWAQAIDHEMKSDEFDMKTYRDLCRSANEESRTIALLDAKLRLAHESTYDRTKLPKRRSRSAGLTPPWETSRS
jgi:hypothetical protein